MPAGLGQSGHQRGAHIARRMGGRIGQYLEGNRQQGVSRQHRRHLVKGNVGGGAATAQVVIVHAGQVVMHQAVGMQGLDGRADPQGPAVIHPEQPGGVQHQERPQPLAPGHHGIAHGLLHPGLAAGGLWQHRIQGRIDQLGGGRDDLRQVGRLHTF